MEDNKLLDKIEKKIIQILKKEGGAAGLAPLKKATDKMDQPKGFNLKSILKKMKNVEKHKESDYILTPINENTPTSVTDKDLDNLEKIVLKYVKDPDDAEAEVQRFDDGGFDAMSDMVTANLLRDPEYKKWYNNLHSIGEGSCGYGPDGVPGDTPGGTRGVDADDRTRSMLKMLIQKEIAKLKEDSFDDRLKSMMGADDFEKATSKDVPGLGDTVIDDKTNISMGRKTFMKMMMQFTDEPFLIETGLKLYDAWARGEGGLKPSRILKILQDTSN